MQTRERESLEEFESLCVPEPQARVYISTFKFDQTLSSLCIRLYRPSELNVDNWNDNCKAKSEAKSPRPLRGLQVDFSLT